MPTQYQLVDPATGTLEYEYLQSRVQTQYYLQYGIDLLVILVIALIAARSLSWRNWVSEIFGRRITKLHKSK